MSERMVGALLVGVSAVAFGSMALFGRWAQESGATTPGLLCVRFTIAALILVCFMRVRGMSYPSSGDLLPIIAMGGIGYVGQAYCYFLALEHAEASLVALLLYLFPAFVAILAAVFLRERIGLVTAVALVLALAGTALVVGGGSGRPLGIALGIGAAVIYSIYITVGSVVTRGLDAIAVSTVVCIAAAVSSGLIVLALVGTGHEVSLAATTRGWVSLAAIAVLGTVIAILAFFAGLRLLGPTSTSVLSTLEPVVTVGLATWLLGESLSSVQAIGAALVLAAVLWLAVSQRPSPAEVPPV